ncbi:GNAT family N-acetyltransferase [Robertmurraya kyonggiensis]|uniref:GNAT family N-acetyltransferase n=1 Tax=Robertmurraya kyonggiensis TaxID=1037680 RepID=A0A4U1D3B1_9BACI|nr:GNAT family N-acetyltransferase [Robertmurraya kyonggiensis]TKC16278.1 GNAT family N-acetyltransferase [Robertmurraya kyonggiensis]
MIRKFMIGEKGEEVLRLQRQAYKVEAAYIGTYDIPPLKETLEELLNSRETFIGYFVDDTLAGILSYKFKKGVIDIHRVMVHPAFFRRGIAGSLIQYIEDKMVSAEFAIVSTGAKNIPAIKLYEKLGFEELDQSVVGDGLVLTNLKKKLKKDR